MSTLKIASNRRTLTLDTTTAIEATHAYVISLLRAIDEFEVAAPTVTSIRLARATGEDHDYRIEASDGRTWQQVIRVPMGVGEATMSFAVPSFWRLSEFSRQRPIRDLLITLVKEFGLTTGKIVWEAVP